MHLFGVNELAQQYLAKPIQLIDLTSISDIDLLNKGIHGSMEYVMKHTHEKDILPFIQKLMPKLKMLEDYQHGKYLNFLIKYVVSVNEVRDVDAFIDNVLYYFSEDFTERMMTIIEQLKERARTQGLAEGREQGLVEGHEEGREKGLEQGLEQGREQVLKQMINSMLQEGFSMDIVSRIAQLDPVRVDEIVKQKDSDS
jgi:predicted transposase/invertase (TIGR01784 family)